MARDRNERAHHIVFIATIVLFLVGCPFGIIGGISGNMNLMFCALVCSAFMIVLTWLRNLLWFDIKQTGLALGLLACVGLLGAALYWSGRLHWCLHHVYARR